MHHSDGKLSQIRFVFSSKLARDGSPGRARRGGSPRMSPARAGASRSGDGAYPGPEVPLDPPCPSLERRSRLCTPRPPARPPNWAKRRPDCRWRLAPGDRWSPKRPRRNSCISPNEKSARSAGSLKTREAREAPRVLRLCVLKGRPEKTNGERDWGAARRPFFGALVLLVPHRRGPILTLAETWVWAPLNPHFLPRPEPQPSLLKTP